MIQDALERHTFKKKGKITEESPLNHKIGNLHETLRNAFHGAESRFKSTEKTEAPKEIKIPNEIKEPREPKNTISAGFELKK